MGFFKVRIDSWIEAEVLIEECEGETITIESVEKTILNDLEKQGYKDVKVLVNHCEAESVEV